ncbi:hypothetical protein MAUB1S_09371 [Mycolicibacterium aubagnense]
MRKVLVVYFSQTGQLRRIAESVAAPLARADDISLRWLSLKPTKPYPFPWPFFAFFDQFPEAVYLDPPELEPFGLLEGEHFDLVILAYTVWYLSPSPPITAFLKSPEGRRILAGTPVVTLIGCRNMWLQAQERTKELLTDAGARLIDNIVLTDRGSAMKTLVTTPHWMFTGRREAFWGGFFPRAGIAEEDIAGASRFGRAILTAMRAGLSSADRPIVTGLRAATVDQRLIASEEIGRRSFMLWGRLLRRCGRQGDAARKPVIVLWACVLFLLIVTVVPVTMALRSLLKPFRKNSIRRQRDYFEGPSGSADFRMGEFS